jgi:tetratricopeptide (TPR) repeat protein
LANVTATIHSTTPSQKRASGIIAAIVMVALTVIAYFPITKAAFIWDDDQHITQNHLLLDTDGLMTMWTKLDALPQYYPLTHTFFWIEHHLWGNNPVGYHLVNVIVHAMNALLVWKILRRLVIPGAGLAAMLFALHPVNVETVAWISEGKNTFSALFYLLSFWTFLRTSFFDSALPARKSDGQWYALSFGFFVCALLCKTVASSLPAAILLLVFLKSGTIRRRNVLPLIPYFAIGILLSLNTAYLERTHVKAVGADWTFASSVPGEMVARCLIAGRAVWFYLVKLCVPLGLSFEYPRWHIDISSPMQYLFPLSAIVAVLSLYWMRHYLGRGMLVGTLFFIGTLVPALGFNNIFPMRYSLVADHFQYLACLGPIVVLAVAISHLSTRRAGEYLPAELIVGVLGLLTWNRCVTFQDSWHLYSDTLAKNPRAWMSNGNLGSMYLDLGRLREAEYYLGRSLAVHRQNPVIATRMGQVYFRREQPQIAVEWYRAAIGLDPHFAESHFELAQALERINNTADALKEYDQAVTIQPKHAPARLAYGILLTKLDRFSEAADQLEQAVQIDPRSKTAHTAYTLALERTGRFDEAAEQINILLQRDAKDPAVLYKELGLVELARHRAGPAIEAFRKSLAIDPNQPDVQERINALVRQSAAPH